MAEFDKDNPVTKSVLMPQSDSANTLLSNLLKLNFPFYVDCHSFDEKVHMLSIHITYHPKNRFPCNCGEENLKIHSKQPRTWQHLDTMDYKTFIEMDIPRIHCPKCGITTVALPWARPFSGMTTDLEARINALATTTNITNVHKLTGISPNRVTRTIIHYVEAARKQSDMSKVQAVGVDETSES